MHDLVIRGGTVVDGTGGAAFTGDVAITGGKVVERGRVEGEGREEIDATGKLVTPGFVDVHTHYDGQVTWDPHAHAVHLARRHHRRHGQLRGGVRARPSRPPRLADRAHGGRRGHPRRGPLGRHHLGLGDLPRVPRLPRRPAARASTSAPRCRTAPSAVTSWGSAARRTSLPLPTTSPRWRASSREGIDAGALGVSTSRTIAHRAIDGEPVPGTYAAEDELFALGRALARRRHGRLRARAGGRDGRGPRRVGEGDGLDAPARRGDRASGHVRDGAARLRARPVAPHARPRASRPTRTVSRSGPRSRAARSGSCSGCRPSTRSRDRPSYQAIDALPLDEKVARMRDPEVRRAILSEVPVADPATAFVGMGLDRIFRLGRAARLRAASRGEHRGPGRRRGSRSLRGALRPAARAGRS